MQYKVIAYKCKIGEVLELGDEIIPAGVTYEGGDLFVVCLSPLEEKHLPEENEEEEKEDLGEGAPSGD